MTHKRTSTMAVQLGQRVMFADVSYYVLPRQEESFIDPGHTPECEVLDIQRDGTSIMYLLTRSEIKDIEGEILDNYEQDDY